MVRSGSPNSFQNGFSQGSDIRLVQKSSRQEMMGNSDATTGTKCAHRIFPIPVTLAVTASRVTGDPHWQSGHVSTYAHVLTWNRKGTQAIPAITISVTVKLCPLSHLEGNRCPASRCPEIGARPNWPLPFFKDCGIETFLCASVTKNFQYMSILPNRVDSWSGN